MLILTRTIGEKIKIGDEIEVTVLNRRGNHIVLGIDAPREVSIKRTELCDLDPTQKQAKQNAQKLSTKISRELPTDSTIHAS